MYNVWYVVKIKVGLFQNHTPGQRTEIPVAQSSFALVIKECQLQAVSDDKQI